MVRYLHAQSPHCELRCDVNSAFPEPADAVSECSVPTDVTIEMQQATESEANT
jgi:hypothetical protein